VDERRKGTETGRGTGTGSGRRSILIIGGGFAGISAACRLAGDGHRPLLLERAARLGGRAASFDDARTGERIDYGHHVSMRCCSATDGFLRRIGAGDALVYQEPLSVPMLCGDRRSTLTGSLWLPGLVHLAPSLFQHRCLSTADRFRAGRAALALAFRRGGSDAPFGAWLRSHGQGDAILSRLWDPICVATLNAHVDQVSLRAARHVLQNGFFDPNRAGMGFFLHPLGDLFEAASDYIDSRGGAVRCARSVRSIRFETDRCILSLSDGGQLEADHVISAVPPWDLARIVDDARLEPLIRAAGRLAWAPIIDVHFWFDGPISDDAFFVAVESPVQAAFDLTRIHRAPEGFGHHIVISLSAASDRLDRPAEETGAELLAELRRLLPGAKPARLKRQLVLTHRNATFVLAPGTHELRPGPESPIDRLLLAGDWTATGWPSTIEGAVRSGIAAAGRLAAQMPEPTQPPETSAPLDPSRSAI